MLCIHGCLGFLQNPTDWLCKDKLYNTVVSLSRITLRWPISTHAQKVVPFYLNDPVFQFSQTGYQTERMSL